MAPTRQKERVSVLGRSQTRSEEKLHLKSSRSRETRRQSSLPPDPASLRSSSSNSLKPKQKVRTISVPAGLKEILNDLSKEVKERPESSLLAVSFR